MRVIAGAAGGRRLAAPPGRAVRPTSDRVREAMFSSLGPRIAAAEVLDLYAGSGALGIEALSRGAAHATFVERDPRVAAVVAQNLTTTGLADRAEVHRTDAAAFARQRAARAFTVVFCDPPYDTPMETIVRLLEDLSAAEHLAFDVTVVVERDRRDPALAEQPEHFGLLAVERRRSYGDTVLLYLRIGD